MIQKIQKKFMEANIWAYIAKNQPYVGATIDLFIKKFRPVIVPGLKIAPKQGQVEKKP